MEVNPRNLCVTGTFTRDAPLRVAPRERAMVMAETQRSPESVRPIRVLAHSHGSARTPPPAFPFLQTTCQRAPGRDGRTRTVRLSPSRSLRKRSRSPGHPREASCSIRRLPAHCRTSVHDARGSVININTVACQLVKRLIFAFSGAKATLVLPQNRPHCNADNIRGF